MSNLELMGETNTSNFNFFKEKNKKNKVLKHIYNFTTTLLISASFVGVGFYWNKAEIKNNEYTQVNESVWLFLDKTSKINTILRPISEDEFNASINKKTKTPIDVISLKKEINSYINDFKTIKNINSEYISYKILSGLMVSIKNGNYSGYIKDKDYEDMINKYKEIEITKLNKISCPIWDKSCDLKEYKETFNIHLGSIGFNNYILNLDKKDYDDFIKLPMENKANISKKFQNKFQSLPLENKSNIPNKISGIANLLIM